jgi:predicted RNase H-like nuclease (RuvC/YqgF family)
MSRHTHFPLAREKTLSSIPEERVLDLEDDIRKLREENQALRAHIEIQTRQISMYIEMFSRRDDITSIESYSTPHIITDQ